MTILARSVVVCFCLMSYYANSQDAAPTKIHSNKRLYAGAVIPFYTNNPDHTAETRGGFAFNIGFKRTFRIFDNSLETGLEYVNHEVSFRSYYFAPGYSKLYDKTFPFIHDLKINELQLPIIFKQTFGKETKHQATSYFTVGWIWRYFVYSSTSIQSINDGIQVYDGKTDVTFEYPFPWAHFGSLLQGGLGLQFNNIQKQTALFFEVNYKYGISRFHYVGNGNTNDLFIKDSNISINVGYKF
jgi:hypothetical protein